MSMEPTRDLGRPLTLAERDALSERIAACRAMRDAGQRALMLERLPAAIRDRVNHHDAHLVMVTNMVATCAEMPGGIVQLVAALRHVEGGTYAMAEVDQLLAGLASVPASTPGVTAAPRAALSAATPGQREALELLLMSLFDSDALRRFVAYGPEGDAILRESMPGEVASLAKQAHAAVDAWIRRGHLTATLFTRLEAARESRVDEIDRVRRLCFP